MNTSKPDTDTMIPTDLKNAAAEIAAVCRKYKLYRCHATIQPPYEMGCGSHEVQLNWSQGRHGEDKDILRLTFTRNIVIDVNSITLVESTM